MDGHYLWIHICKCMYMYLYLHLCIDLYTLKTMSLYQYCQSWSTTNFIPVFFLSVLLIPSPIVRNLTLIILNIWSIFLNIINLPSPPPSSPPYTYLPHLACIPILYSRLVHPQCGSLLTLKCTELPPPSPRPAWTPFIAHSGSDSPQQGALMCGCLPFLGSNTPVLKPPHTWMSS